MKKILEEISKRALLLNEYDFSEEQIESNWLGFEPATDEQIEEAQKRLGIKLPQDYIDFLKITNGFPEYSVISPSFLPVEKIDYLNILNEDFVNVYPKFEDPTEIEQGVPFSLLIAGLDEEQSFLIIPPNNNRDKWLYCKSAYWIPGEEEFNSLENYFIEDLEFLRQETEGLIVPKPKFITDLSLRDAIFQLEWQNVFDLSFKFLLKDTPYFYFGGQGDLFALMLLAAKKLNKYEILENALKILKAESKNLKNIDHLISRYEEAAKSRLAFIDDFQFNKFPNQEPFTTLDKIEEQIKSVRKDLLKEKNFAQKVDYQLSFLFSYGSATSFLEYYETYEEIAQYDAHLKAAIVYMTVNNNVEARKAIERYYDSAFNYRPLAPFLDQNLINLMDVDFSKHIFNKMIGS